VSSETGPGKQERGFHKQAGLSHRVSSPCLSLSSAFFKGSVRSGFFTGPGEGRLGSSAPSRSQALGPSNLPWAGRPRTQRVNETNARPLI
jgi:hypothetical protein